MNQVLPPIAIASLLGFFVTLTPGSAGAAGAGRTGS
jgi:hypothetical protein